MEVQHYTCNSSFPYEVQDILRDKGFFVDPLHEVHPHTNRIHGAFSFRITRRSDTLRVLGVEDKGEFHFHMVEDPSDGVISTNVSSAFFNEVEEVMLQNGADLGEITELD